MGYLIFFIILNQIFTIIFLHSEIKELQEDISSLINQRKNYEKEISKYKGEDPKKIDFDKLNAILKDYDAFRKKSTHSDNQK